MYSYTAHITDSFMAVYNFLLDEIDHQLVKAPIAAAISPYLISPTQPMHGKTDHNTGNYISYSFRVLSWKTITGDNAFQWSENKFQATSTEQNLVPLGVLFKICSEHPLSF